MKISRLLKILEDLVALKCSDPTGKHGRRFYRNLHRILRAFLSQDGLPLKAKLRALTPSMAVYAKVRFHELIISEDANNCVQFIAIEVARVLLESDYLKLRESDPSKCLFVQTLQQTKCQLKSSHDGRLFEALDNVMTTEWSHPVLLKMLQQEHSQTETIPYAAFIESVENSDIIRLRVRMLLECGCRDLAHNLISWCVASKMFQRDIYILLHRLDFLHESNRAEEFHELCRQISCCTMRELLDSAKQGTIVSIGRSSLLAMSRTFFLLDWVKATDLTCTRELLSHWLTMEHETLKGERQSATAAFNKVVALAHSIRQLVLFVDVLESQFGSEYLTFCSELMESAIRQERHRLNCARLYRRDVKDAQDVTESLVAICRVLGRIYKDHCQMNLSCRLSSLYLDPTVANFSCLEKDYIDLDYPPSSEATPPSDVSASVYRTLLSAVELLRPESFGLSSLWPELKPVLVTYMEDAGFRYSKAKNRFKSRLKRVEAGDCFGSVNGELRTNNADSALEALSPRKKKKVTIGNGFIKSEFVKSDRLMTDLAKKEPKVDSNGNKRKQTLDGASDFAPSEQVSKKMRCVGSALSPKHAVLPSASESSGSVAGESGGEYSADSCAVLELSSSLSKMSGSEMRRQSLLTRRYVWNSTSSSASTSNSRKINSLNTVEKSDKDQDSHDIRKNTELRSTCACFNSDVGNCSNSGLTPCSLAAAGKLDKNSNLRVESANFSNATAFDSGVIANPSTCSDAVKSNAEVAKVKGRASVLGGWESKFMAYCSSVSESDMEFDQCVESSTAVTINGTVATTDFSVANTDLAAVTSASITSVSYSSSTVSVVSSVTVAGETSPSWSGFLESLSSPKVARMISENQASCSSECWLIDSNTLVDVKSSPTAVEDFVLTGSSSVMFDTCQSSVRTVTPALYDMVTGLNSACHSEVASSDVNSITKIMRSTTSETLPCEEPVTAHIGALRSSFPSRMEEPLPPPVNTLTPTLAGSFPNEASSGELEYGTAFSICPSNEESLVTTTSVDSSSRSTRPSCTSIPGDAISVTVAAVSDESMTSRVVGSWLPVMSVAKEERSVSAELQPAVLADDITYTVAESVLESQPSFETPGATTPYSAARSHQSDELSQVGSSPHDIIASINGTCLEASVSDASLVSSQNVVEMLETVGQRVTCHRKKRHSVDFVERLWKMLRPDGKAGSSSSSPVSSRGSDLAETNAAEGNEGAVDHQNGSAIAMDVDDVKSSPTDVGDFVPNGSSSVMLDTCQSSSRAVTPALDDLAPGLNGAYDSEVATSEVNSVSRIMSSVVVTEELFAPSMSQETSGSIVLNDFENALAVGFQDNYIENDNSHEKLSETSNSEDITTEQTLDEITNSSPILQTYIGHVEVGTDSTPSLKTDGLQTEDVNDGPLLDLSIFNAPENEQHLLLYNSLRQEHERNQESRHMLAMLRFDDMKVPVSNKNLFYYERALPGVRGALTNCKSDEGNMSNCDTKDLLNSEQSLLDVKCVGGVSTLLDGGCASDGRLKRVGSPDDRHEIKTQPTCDDEKLISNVPVDQDDSEKDQELSRANCCKGGTGLVEDDSNKGPGLSTKLVASGEHLNVDRSTGDGAKLGKGKNYGAESSRKAQGSVGRKSSKAQGSVGRKPGKVQDSVRIKLGKAQGGIERKSDIDPPGESLVKGQSPVGKSQSKKVPGAGYVCILCGKSLSSDRNFRMHLMRIHEMDVVNRRSPEEGYRCRLCDLHWKLLSICTCRHKNKSGEIVRSSGKISKSKLPEKPTKDSLGNVTGSSKKKARRCSNRKDSLDDSVALQSNDQSLSSESNSQSKEKKKPNSRNIPVTSAVKVIGESNDGGIEGGSERRVPRKRLIRGSKKKPDSSSVSIDNRHGVRKHLGGADSGISCPSKKRLFSEGDGETTDVSFPSAPRRSNARKCNAGVDSARVKAAQVGRSSVEGTEKSSQKRWILRDRLKGKTT